MLDGRVSAAVEKVEVRDKEGDHFTLGPPQHADLSTFDVVQLRQDPPFDMGYITTTHLLERIHPKTLVVNDPAHVRNAPEKLFVTEFTKLTPPTLIARDRAAILDFRDKHGDIIVKPLYGNGGAGVFRIAGGDENLAALLEMFEGAFREPFVVQRYLPEVRKGDKRIILVDGEVAGAINRVPAAGEARSNMHVGGKPEAVTLSARDKEICDAIGPTLKERGLIFVGIDVIGEWLTEINVTSPTGIREVKRFGGPDIAALIWDAVEKKLGRS
jgi:glutathione synthase